MELYIHIPFCIRKCSYCDFLSGPADEQTQDRYMKALLREVALAGEKYNKDEKAGDDRDSEVGVNATYPEIVDTIFIGGGTPSAVEAGWIVRLMEQVRCSFVLAENAEITMEANPGTLTAEKLARYRQAGINRLSIGLQSTDDGELARLGRIHTYQEFLENYRLAREAGFTNINIDLMSALPGQTVESYEKTLRRIIALEPEHISAYSLIIEEGTPFGDRYPERIDGEGLSEEDSKGSGSMQACWQLPTEEEDRQMYHLTKSILAEAGYERYEISNYARSGQECRHNVGYWTGVPYLGLGLGAASYYDGQRFSNTRDMGEYLTSFELQNRVSQQLTDQSQHSFWEKVRKDIQTLTMQERMEEFMFLGLRLTKGISGPEFAERFGQTLESVYGDILRKMKSQELMVCSEERWYLTDLGLDVSNYVLAEFLL